MLQIQIRLDGDYWAKFGDGIWRHTCIEGWIENAYYQQGYGQLYFCIPVPILIISGCKFKVVYEYDE